MLRWFFDVAIGRWGFRRLRRGRNPHFEEEWRLALGIRRRPPPAGGKLGWATRNELGAQLLSVLSRHPAASYTRKLANHVGRIMLIAQIGDLGRFVSDTTES